MLTKPQPYPCLPHPPRKKTANNFLLFSTKPILFETFQLPSPSFPRVCNFTSCKTYCAHISGEFPMPACDLIFDKIWIPLPSPSFCVKRLFSFLLIFFLSGDDSWKVLAHTLAMDNSSIRFLQERKDNPADEVLRFWEVKSGSTVGALYNILVELGYPYIADILWMLRSRHRTHPPPYYIPICDVRENFW